MRSLEAIRRKENVQVTRLTVVKKLCENPEAAGAFAMFLARKSQTTSLRSKANQALSTVESTEQFREMKPYLVVPAYKT